VKIRGVEALQAFCRTAGKTVHEWDPNNTDRGPIIRELVDGYFPRTRVSGQAWLFRALSSQDHWFLAGGQNS
jgi:hypothetical protein